LRGGLRGRPGRLGGSVAPPAGRVVPLVLVVPVVPGMCDVDHPCRLPVLHRRIVAPRPAWRADHPPDPAADPQYRPRGDETDTGGEALLPGGRAERERNA